jgi:hypothetical protein
MKVVEGGARSLWTLRCCKRLSCLLKRLSQSVCRQANAEYFKKIGQRRPVVETFEKTLTHVSRVCVWTGCVA